MNDHIPSGLGAVDRVDSGAGAESIHSTSRSDSASMVRDGKQYNASGEVAVLVSPGYGAGWYSWNTGNTQCLFEPRIVQWVLAGKPENERPNAEEMFGPDHFCDLGMDDLEVHWLAPGTQFRIDEYDGSESLVVNGDDFWKTA